jgi:hypothetical protein
MGLEMSRQWQANRGVDLLGTGRDYMSMEVQLELNTLNLA